MIFLGPPGVGKTHLAISLAIAAAQSGRRVYYGTLADLITSLEEAQAALDQLPLRIGTKLTRGQAEDLLARLVRERVSAKVVSME